jgi:hypothetical protein
LKLLKSGYAIDTTREIPDSMVSAELAQIDIARVASEAIVDHPNDPEQAVTTLLGQKLGDACRRLMDSAVSGHAVTEQDALKMPADCRIEPSLKLTRREGAPWIIDARISVKNTGIRALSGRVQLKEGSTVTLDILAEIENDRLKSVKGSLGGRLEPARKRVVEKVMLRHWGMNHRLKDPTVPKETRERPGSEKERAAFSERQGRITSAAQKSGVSTARPARLEKQFSGNMAHLQAGHGVATTARIPGSLLSRELANSQLPMVPPWIKKNPDLARKAGQAFLEESPDVLRQSLERDCRRMLENMVSGYPVKESDALRVPGDCELVPRLQMTPRAGDPSIIDVRFSLSGNVSHLLADSGPLALRQGSGLQVEISAEIVAGQLKPLEGSLTCSLQPA